MHVAMLVQSRVDLADLPSLGFPHNIYCLFLSTADIF